MGGVFVPGVGSLAGGVPVLVGEAPGREEELRREPFVGQAGQNLGALLAQIGWSRDVVFLTNLLKYRPIDAAGANRTPTGSEGRHALSYLLEELTILEPSLVVCLGLTAGRILLEDPGLKMGRVNGSLFFRHGYRIAVMYHPSPFNYHVPSKRAALVEAFRQLKLLSV
jgi:DNA polymerase